jgi:tRNA(Ile)-lysidine synthase
MPFSTAFLRETLRNSVPAQAVGLVVAVSGGEDSAGLLAALAQLADALAPLRLRAVHVDHGLQPAAAALAAAARAQCARWQMPLSILRVQVDGSAGSSLEEAARDARYAALAADLQPGECLLTAHHREDQAETLLLQALRGAGLKGLCAMPALRAFGAGWHLRPLLDAARAELRAFAAAHGGGAVPDPMNAAARFDRVYLRTEVWPLLERRWPGAATALTRSAAHLADAQALLDDIGDADLGDLSDGRTLSLSRLRGLKRTRQINVLRRWLAQGGAPMPPSARLHEALRQMLDAAADHVPETCWGGYALRRYQDRLHLTAAEPPRIGEGLHWAHRADGVLKLGRGLGRLRIVQRPGGLDAARLPATFRVRRREGGETLRPGPRAATQSVQHLCQARGVLPWMRDALPFIFAGSDLVAVGDLWSEAGFGVADGAAGLGFAWEDAPNLL